MCKEYFYNRGKKSFPYHVGTILISMDKTLDLSSTKVPKFVIGEIQPPIERTKSGVDKFYLVRSVVSILG